MFFVNIADRYVVLESVGPSRKTPSSSYQTFGICIIHPSRGSPPLTYLTSEFDLFCFLLQLHPHRWMEIGEPHHLWAVLLVDKHHAYTVLSSTIPINATWMKPCPQFNLPVHLVINHFSDCVKSLCSLLCGTGHPTHPVLLAMAKTFFVCVCDFPQINLRALTLINYESNDAVN